MPLALIYGLLMGGRISAGLNWQFTRAELLQEAEWLAAGTTALTGGHVPRHHRADRWSSGGPPRRAAAPPTAGLRAATCRRHPRDEPQSSDTVSSHAGTDARSPSACTFGSRAACAGGSPWTR